jgi:hypothetical protein
MSSLQVGDRLVTDEADKEKSKVRINISPVGEVKNS